MDRQESPGSAGFSAGSRPTPDISEISVAAPGPLGGAGILDAQAPVERHAMRSAHGPVHGALALLTDRGRHGLPGQQHGVDVRLGRRHDPIRDNDDEQGDEGGRVAVPLSEQAGDGIVNGFEQPHGGE